MDEKWQYGNVLKVEGARRRLAEVAQMEESGSLQPILIALEAALQEQRLLWGRTGGKESAPDAEAMAALAARAAAEEKS